MFSHFGIPLLVGGRPAVQLFFMLSGFLMSYLLVEVKSYPSVRNFYFSRFVRLLPLYCFIALLSFIEISTNSTSLYSIEMQSIFNLGEWYLKILIVFTNATLLLQDLVFFFQFENSQLSFTSNFHDTATPLYQILLVPQSWTLSLEIMFYILAPFILRSKRRIFLVFTLSLLVRIPLFVTNLATSDPWTYRFFPAEISLFLLGAISHQYIANLFTSSLTTVRVFRFENVAYFISITLILLLGELPISGMLLTAILLACFFLLIPALFRFQIKNRFDNFLGEFSFPIYLSHILVQRLFERFFSLDGNAQTLAMIFSTICISYLLIIWVVRPIDRFRNKLKK